ncbi:hypothetical protein DFH07DRAFT_707424, partial [Mycena maculata]
APLVFGEICRHWRAIALSLPCLWNSISLDCTRLSKIQRNIVLCGMWFKRSGSLPLSIRLHRQPQNYVLESIEWCCSSLIRSILPYANRWRFVDL